MAHDDSTILFIHFDLYCYDETRVILNAPSDYIHANWINIGNNQRIICTQAPMDNTIKDFWRMVIQEECKMVIMLCDLIENGYSKCSKYWPETEETGSLQIQIEPDNMLTIICTNKSVMDDNFVKSTLLLNPAKKKSWQLVHYHWKKWPDRSIPDSDYLRVFKLHKQISSTYPTIVHCSSGVGRAGTFMAILKIFNSLLSNQNSLIKIEEAIRELRAQRYGCVQTDIQYLYIHRVFIELGLYLNVANNSQSFIVDYENFVKKHVRF